MTVEFRADLLPAIQELAIQARRDVLSKTLTGNWLSSFKGQGMEFSGYREYQVTDDSRKIDWRASLRAHKLLIKELQEDKTLRVTILVDTSSTMLYGSGEHLKAEVAANIASTMAYPALRSGDQCGLVLFSDDIKHYMKPAVGMQQHAAMAKELIKPQHYGGEFHFSQAIRHAVSMIRGRGLLILISDFIGLQEGWDKEIRAAHEKFDVIAVMLRDPRDRKLPANAGSFELEDPETGETITIDTHAYAKPYKEYVIKEEADIIHRFQQARADIVTIEVGEDIREALVAFFGRRAAHMQV